MARRRSVDETISTLPPPSSPPSSSPRRPCAQRDPNNPTWWDKYTYLAKNGPLGAAGPTASLLVGTNVDVSNECGPQSETYVTIDTTNPSVLAGGSNEIFRLPMRGYFSSDGGATWGGVDLPLPPAKGANGFDFGSDPSLAFDTRGNVFYSYIVVFFGNGQASTGRRWPSPARSTAGRRTPPRRRRSSPSRAGRTTSTTSP